MTTATPRLGAPACTEDRARWVMAESSCDFGGSDWVMVALGDESKPPKGLDVSLVQGKVQKEARNQPSWAGGRELGKANNAPGAARLHLDDHVRLTDRPSFRLNPQPPWWVPLEHRRFVVYQNGPHPEGVMQLRILGWPRVIDRSHARRPDHPDRKQPTLRKNVEHSLWCALHRRDIYRHRSTALPGEYVAKAPPSSSAFVLVRIQIGRHIRFSATEPKCAAGLNIFFVLHLRLLAFLGGARR